MFYSLERLFLVILYRIQRHSHVFERLLGQKMPKLHKHLVSYVFSCTESFAFRNLLQPETPIKNSIMHSSIVRSDFSHESSLHAFARIT